MPSAETSTVASSLGPVRLEERIHSLDILRGFALLGILLMNMEGFCGPVLEAGSGINPLYQGADRWADVLVYFFVQGKFFTLFSLLFGMGFAVMSQRATAAARPLAATYLRRSLALLGFGLLHAIFIWSGDILVTYALLAFLLLAFRDIGGRWLVVLAVAAWLASIGMMMLVGVLDSVMQLSPASAASWQQAMGKQQQVVVGLIESQRALFGAGTYWEAVGQRARDLQFALMGITTYGPLVFGMFLLGSWFVKSGAILQPQAFPRLYGGLRWVVLPLGIAVMATSVALAPTIAAGASDVKSMSALSLSLAAGVMMSLGYLGWMMRALAVPGLRRVLAWLAPAGRMALTNYLLQSVVCTFVFYGYGLGYFEQMSRSSQVVFAFALFALQVVASRWWLRHFRFGPMEWLWRALTYLKPPAWRRVDARMA